MKKAIGSTPSVSMITAPLTDPMGIFFSAQTPNATIIFSSPRGMNSRNLNSVDIKPSHSPQDRPMAHASTPLQGCHSAVAGQADTYATRLRSS